MHFQNCGDDQVYFICLKGGHTIRLVPKEKYDDLLQTKKETEEKLVESAKIIIDLNKKVSAMETKTYMGTHCKAEKPKATKSLNGVSKF
jgi:hypothetical protein